MEKNIECSQEDKLESPGCLSCSLKDKRIGRMSLADKICIHVRGPMAQDQRQIEDDKKTLAGLLRSLFSAFNKRKCLSTMNIR